MKGISAVVAGTIILLLIILGVIPLIMLYINTMQETYRAYSLSSSLNLLKDLESINANLSNGILTVENTGPITIAISYFTLKDREGTCSLIVNAFDAALRYAISSNKVTLDSANNLTVLEPGGYIKINITKLGLNGIKGVCNIATARGNVIEVKEITTIAQTALTIMATPVTFDVATLTGRTDLSVSTEQTRPSLPSDTGTGMVRVSYIDTSLQTALIRIFEVKSNEGSIIRIWGDESTCNVSYNNIFIGYDPEWSVDKRGTPLYNILITGYEDIVIHISKEGGIEPEVYINNLSGEYYNISDEGNYYRISISGIPYRIKILGFKPTDDLVLYYDVNYNGILEESEELRGKDALGYWWLYSDQYICTSLDNCVKMAKGYLKLNGTAKQVIVYMDADYLDLFNITEGSYDPYLFSADVDGNGYPELLFITEDESCSNANLGSLLFGRFNDVAHIGSYEIDNKTWADDWSIKPFFINLTGYSVEGGKIALVQVAVRVYFHDNLFDNLQFFKVLGLSIPLSEEVEDRSRVLFGIYLIDSITGNIVSSREWNFDELDKLESTFPPNKNFAVLSATLPVPQNGTYFIALGFQDPYEHTDDGFNDGDFIIALEVVSVTYYARP